MPVFRLGRFTRTARLLGASSLVVAATLGGATAAQAAALDVSISPATGPATTAGITYATDAACPVGNQGSAVLQLVDPGGAGTTNLTPVNNSVTTPFTGTFNTTFAAVEQVFPDVDGTSSELAVACFPSPDASGTSVSVQGGFVAISGDGSTYTQGAPPPVATTTTLTATPDPASPGQTVTLTATIAPTDATGTVQFSVGNTAIGSAVNVVNGVATTTTTFGSAGTEALSAVYTPTGNFAPSTGTFNLVACACGASEIPLAVSIPTTGTFSLTVDTVDTVTLVVSGTEATAVTTPIVVTDTRNTFPGWSVTGQAGDFTGSGSAAGATISGDQLGWQPGTSPLTQGGTQATTPLAQGVTLGTTVDPASPGLGTTPAVLAAVLAGSGNGAGTTTLGATLTLAIPATAAAGPYAGQLNITSVSTNP